MRHPPQQSLYLETSTVSAYVDYKNQDALRKAITREFWREVVPHYTIYVGDITLVELQEAEEKHGIDLTTVLTECIELAVTKEIESLVDTCLNEQLFPVSKRPDAIHVVLAAANHVDFLVSWNYAHFVRPHRRKQIHEFLKRYNLFAPEITTPEELLLESQEKSNDTAS